MICLQEHQEDVLNVIVDNELGVLKEVVLLLLVQDLSTAGL